MKPKNITVYILFMFIAYMLCTTRTHAQYEDIFELVKRAQYDTVKTLLNNIPTKDIETEYEIHRSPSMSAKKMGFLSIILAPFLVLDALASKTSHHKITLLEYTVSHGNDSPESIAFIEYLLKRGANPNKYYTRHSPIIIATKSNLTQTTKLLYNNGADVNTWFENAVDIAIENNNQELLAYFIKEKATTFSNMKGGTTALASAIASGDMEMMDLIMDSNPKFVSSTLIDKACDKISASKIRVDDSIYVLMINKLVNHGFNATELDYINNTPLQKAIREKCNGLAHALLPHTKNIDNINSKGETALLTVVENRDLLTMKKLLEAGANVELKNASGENAHTIAIRKNYFDMAEDLENNDPQIRNRNKKLAYLLVNDSIDIKIKNDSALKLIRAGISFDACRIHKYANSKQQYYNGPSNFLPYAVYKNLYAIAEELLIQGVDPNTKDIIDKQYPLQYVFLNQDTNMARLLLNYGADLHITKIKEIIFNKKPQINESAMQLFLKAEFYKSIRLTKGEQGWYYSTIQSPNLFSFYADSATAFTNYGFAYVKQNNKWNIITVNGYKLINDADSLCNFQLVESASKEKYIVIRSFNEGKWKMNNLSRYSNTEREYDLLSAYEFSSTNGQLYALCKLEGKYCFIDTDEYIKEQFDKLSVDQKGRILGTTKGKTKRLRYKGKIAAEFLQP